MESLPEDVIMNILSRLAVKCLLRCRFLSKLFCSLIDSQDFVKIHLQRSIETNSNLSLLLCGMSTPFLVPSPEWASKIFSASLDSMDFAVLLDHPFKNGKIEIIGSCNGLIALRNHENDMRKDLALLNPSTRKHIILPEICGDLKDCHFYANGFGYDAASDDYKLVRIIQFGRKLIKFTELVVYSLRTNSWRRFRVAFPYLLFFRYDGTFADGHLHWLASRIAETRDKRLIVSLDLKSEKFHEVQLATTEKERLVGVMFLGTLLKGCLYFVCYSEYPNPIDIWLMKKES